MAASTTITVRISQKLKKRIDRIAKQWGRSRSDLGTEALESYVESSERALKRIEEGIAAAERGDFATDEEVKATFARLKKKYRAR